MSQLTATQNTIRNKFQKTYTNRLEHEQDVKQSLNSLSASTLPTATESPMVTTIASPLTSTTASSLETTIASLSPAIPLNNHYNPNKLCAKLRLLIDSPVADNLQQKREIRSIIKQLRELKIIV